MLTGKQIEEIKEHLEKAQNPIFYYDNDADGLCSFLLLRRYLGRGKGVVVRSFPDLNKDYARKAQQLGSDYVFILDKPVIGKDFVEEISGMGLPIVWIDHHETKQGRELEKEFDNFTVYNPTLNTGKDKSEEPVTYLCHKIADRKEDLWIALIGCIADHFLPDFADEFAERYREFWNADVKEPFDAYYRAEIGRVIQIFNFSLKDSLTNVVAFQNFLIGAKGPDDVLLEAESGRAFMQKYNEIKKKYDALLARAKENTEGKLLFFEYGGETSMSADVSNALSYLYRDKYIVIARKYQGVVSVSMRGKGIRDILERVLKRMDDAMGGGHPDAAGARLKAEDLEEFKKILEEEISK